MVRLGPYRQVFEAHRDSFRKIGYSEKDACAMAQAVVFKPLPESALTCLAPYLESVIPNVKILLEYNQYEGLSLKVNEAVQENANLFRDNDDPKDQTLIVSGVYPGMPGMVVVKALETGCWYAADWALESDEITIGNVRDIGTYYETLAVAVTEGLMPALDLVFLDRTAPLEVEHEFLEAAAFSQEVDVPAVVLDGARPFEEMEYVKFLRNTSVLTETFTAPFELPEMNFTPSMDSGEAIGRLAMNQRALSLIGESYDLAIKALRNPLTVASKNGHRVHEAGDMRSIGGNHVFVDDAKAAKGDLSGVEKQIDTHNDMRSELEDADFQNTGSGYGDQGEEHTKDAGNGYHVKVCLSGGKAHTTVHRNGGSMVKAVGTARSSDTMMNHVDDAMSAAASQPAISGYEA
jgi:hypothetical protein